MEITRLQEITPQIVHAFGRLIPQLSATAQAPDANALTSIIRSGNTVIFAAWEGGEMTGALTFATYQTPTGIKAWIEDVVVDHRARGKGIGKKLTLHALEHARSLGLSRVDLTSGPERVEANELYRRIGFERRNTNVYRYTL